MWTDTQAPGIIVSVMFPATFEHFCCCETLTVLTRTFKYIVPKLLIYIKIGLAFTGCHSVCRMVRRGCKCDLYLVSEGHPPYVCNKSPRCDVLLFYELLIDGSYSLINGIY